jgi:hypothetical protein
MGAPMKTTLPVQTTQPDQGSVEQACDDIRRGAVAGLNPDYPPSAPRIHQIADEKANAARLESARLTLLLTARVEEAKPAPTPDERERVAASLQTFHERLGPNPLEADRRKAERERADHKKAEREEMSRRMEYFLHGFEPPTNKAGVTMSLSFARRIGIELSRRNSAVKSPESPTVPDLAP